MPQAGGSLETGLAKELLTFRPILGRSYGRFCYPTLTTAEPKRTASNRMYVLFSADAQLSARGFKLIFNVSLECKYLQI